MVYRYITKRRTCASRYPIYDHEYGAAKYVYLLTRIYRRSKSNGFTNLIAYIQNMTGSNIHKYYYYLNKWDDGTEDENFVIERHGNATRSYCGAYYRKDP